LFLKIHSKFRFRESSAYKEKQVPPSVTTATVTDLEPFQLYEISVLAINAIGRGIATMPKEVQTDEFAPTTPPQRVQARALNRNSILVRWDPPEKPNGQITLEVKSDELITTLHDLEIEQTYYISVQAKNSKGLSPASKLVTVITKHGIPGQPMSLVAKPLDSRRIHLSWEKPIHSYNIIGYSVWFNNSVGAARQLTLTNPVNKHIIDGLEPNTIYSFRVAAQSSRGLGAYCEDVYAKTYPNVPSGSPKISSFETISSRSIMIQWSTPIIDIQDGDLINYKIKWHPIPDSDSAVNTTADSSDNNELYDDSIENNKDHEWNELVRDATLGNSVVLNDLKPFTSYKIFVAAGSKGGFGPLSQPLYIKTPEDG
ncbi:unnamed protein product, partial [Dracunculus medinensis]|uniref:Fibronectin type-III domain-containing protein n=1 Tax=Dracunculus medinensis TaxID=318479 RepID=A0A0N4UMN9_DRAME